MRGAQRTNGETFFSRNLKYDITNGELIYRISREVYGYKHVVIRHLTETPRYLLLVSPFSTMLAVD